MSNSGASPHSVSHWLLFVGLVLVVALAAGALLMPQVQDRLEWDWERLTARVHDTLYPHSPLVSTPSAASLPPPALVVVLPTPSPDSSEPVTVAPGLTQVPTPTPWVLPSAYEIKGVPQNYQHPNNCGPATLASDLTFWGWIGTQANIAAKLRPDERDRNVSPEDLAAYAQGAGLKTLMRVGGSPELAKRILNLGIPVIVEKATILAQDDPTGGGWAGHYTLLSGYSDQDKVFITQDSLEGPNLRIVYSTFINQWRPFNYLYLVVYPAAREADVRAALAEAADAQANFRQAALLAQQETSSQTGEAQAFAWFNLGTNLNALGDYAQAAQAFDQARQLGLPWRMLWYQFGPYDAYYHTGRFQDLIQLADDTLAVRDSLKETFYWRGMARLALGDKAGAVADWESALEYNRNYAPAADQLKAVGK